MSITLLKFKLAVGTAGFVAAMTSGLTLAAPSVAQETAPLVETSSMEEVLLMPMAGTIPPEEVAPLDAAQMEEAEEAAPMEEVEPYGEDMPGAEGMGSEDMDASEGMGSEEGMSEEEMSEEGTVTVKVNLTDAEGTGEEVGTVTLENNAYGLLLTPDLTGLMPGIHGVHFHQNAACGPAEKEGEIVPGLAAGGHFDPAETGVHEGPYGEGHLGDLPSLYVDAQGIAITPVLAPRLTVEEVAGRALMIHMNGDNFSDIPEALGGGGARFACGVVE